jgi:flagella basal body P-ring formation protein FlgA
MKSGWPGSRLRLAAACALSCAGLSAAAPAVATASSDAIRSAAEQAVRQHYALPGNRVVVHTEPLDTRLQLDDCAQPLIATVPERATPPSHMSVQVQCPQPRNWSVRVPVRMELFRTVLVASHPLQRGDGLGPGDVRTEERDVTRLGYGYVENLQQVAGRTLARSLAKDTVLSPGALGGRRMVRAGDHVQVVARLGSIEVRADGVALGSGDNGARLRVRNENSGKIVDAMVSAPGVVTALP